MSPMTSLRVALTLLAVVCAVDDTCVNVGGVESCSQQQDASSLLQGKVRRTLAAQLDKTVEYDESMLEELTEYEKVSLDDLEEEDAAAEKHNTADFDCADEVILRLAIAESFYGPSYSKCVEQTTNKTFGAGGSGATLMKPKGGSGGGSGFTREQVVQRVHARCITRQGHGVALGPRLIRMTFHDSADYNNSMLYDGTEVPLSKTGVDSCLRTALLSVGLKQKANDDDIEDVAKGDPNHNRGLNNAIKWVLHMASASKLSQPDIQVLGAVVAAEAWLAGPELGAHYGRVKGDCQKINCNSEKCWDNTTPFFKQPVAEPVGSGMFCPMTNTLDPLKNVLGLSMAELVALQGSHSVGGVIVCSGLGNVAAGPYCPDKCGIPPGKFYETGNLDGTAFDDTPGKLDNRYYQLLIKEKYEDLPACTEVKEFPLLSKRGLSRAGSLNKGGSGGSGKNKKDFSKTCTQGVKYAPENVCEVDACVQECAKSKTCLEAANTDDDDVDKYKDAWEGCLYCKKMCSGSHAANEALKAFRSNLTSCRDGCKASPSCNTSATYNFSAAKEKCNTAGTTCNSACEQKDACKTTKTYSAKKAWAACHTAKKTCSGKCDTLDACKQLSEDKYKELKVRGAAKKLHTTCKTAFNACKTTGALKACRDTYKTCVAPLRSYWKLRRACGNCMKPCHTAFRECAQPIRANGKLMKTCRLCKNPCKAARKECFQPLKDMGKHRRSCSVCRRTCVPKARDLQTSIYNASSVTKKPARWCKRLTPTKKCLDPKIKMPINGGWGDCPEDERMQIPNTGAGRLTIIQNLERWTKFHGLYKRVMVLPSDWSHLGSTSGRALFQRYADDEDDWKSMYKQAFNKMASLGSPDLKTCNKVSCTSVDGSLSCPVRGTGIGNAQNAKAMRRMQATRASLGLPAFVRPANLLFDLAQCSPPLTNPAGCEVTGGYGVKAKITCTGYTGYCTTAAAKATEIKISAEWAEGGGQVAPCSDKDAMLETDASPQ